MTHVHAVQRGRRATSWGTLEAEESWAYVRFEAAAAAGVDDDAEPVAPPEGVPACSIGLPPSVGASSSVAFP